ncbi:odorant receptor 13a-like isoform X1 [Megalopta genalis]|uniref:odorant receptor 13a-like isoform X1 n=1 Tax=Megalopta genalis TaxID=115081 RepID=UPI003FD1364B
MHERSGVKVVGTCKKWNDEDDIDYALEMCRRLLKPLGIWSLIYGCTSRREKVVSIILLITCFIGLISIIVPMCCQIISSDVNTMMRVKLLGPISNCMLSAIKYVYLLLRRTTFARCIEIMENDWRTVKNHHHRDIMMKQATFSRTLILLCVVFICFGGISFHFMLPYSRRRVVGNITLKALAYSGVDRFFDIQSSPNYEIIYGVQCFAGFVRHNVTTAACSLIVFFVTHICGQVQIQIARLEELNCEKQEKHRDHDAVAEIIQNHAEILRYAKTIGESFSEIIFMEITASTFLICLLEYCCLTEWMNSNGIAITTYAIYIISLTFNTLIFCYIGEVLTDQCSQIGFASYEVDWYNLPGKNARSFVLLNAISLYPPRLVGGKVTELSLDLFTVILKSSIVYLNLLRTLTSL